MQESELITIWQQQRLERTALRTEAGETLEIVYPGRRNDGRGGDFRDAAIMLGGRLVTGDIEVHVRSGGWREHRHHHDPCYNDVILHVVMWHDHARRPYLDNGWDIPTLALSNYLVAAPAASVWPCPGVSANKAAAVLAEMGEVRFRAKAAQFAAEMTQAEPGECLYRAMMGALGYAKNKLPFIELAHRVPLHVLEDITAEESTEESRLFSMQALLLGAAGLLPSQRPRQRNEAEEEYVNRLEQEWQGRDHCGTMPTPAWELFRLRPANFPTRRIAALTHLLLRYRPEGLLQSVLRLVREAPIPPGHHVLRNGLVVASAGYWLNHYDFGAATKGNLPTLLGDSRAEEIMLNVILPFVFAQDNEMADQALTLYRSYPRVASNSVEKQMQQQLGLSHQTGNTAQRQQGLLQIYHTLCSQGRCGECPLARG